MRCFFNNKSYSPIDPRPDEREDWIEKFDRLMFRHTDNGPEIFVARRGEQNAGWIIGYFLNGYYDDKK